MKIPFNKSGAKRFSNYHDITRIIRQHVIKIANVQLDGGLPGKERANVKSGKIENSFHF